MKIDAYPLCWPPNWPRTPYNERQFARFKTSFASARDGLFEEVSRLGGENIVLSTNIPLRRDGLPYADYREPNDSGVAVYFNLFGKQQCVPCDKWMKVADNMHAVELCIAALRGLERWGAKSMVQASFTGFQALPNYSTPPVRYFDNIIDKEHLKEEYKKLAIQLHPDAGGDASDFSEMNRQYQEAMSK